MPYVLPGERLRLRPLTMELSKKCNTVGELNFVITVLLRKYISDRGLNYTLASAMIGTLECVKFELYRKLLVPYEDEKERANGEIIV